MLLAILVLAVAVSAGECGGTFEYSEATIKPLPAGAGQCWRFSQPFPACGGCETVNNCAPCLGQVCNAITWQSCTMTYSITPTTGVGHYASVSQNPVPCFMVYNCGACQACLSTYSGGVGSMEEEYIVIMGDLCQGTGS